MELTAQLIEGLVNAVLKKNFDSAAEIPDCHRDWWQMCCSKHKFVAIAAPRGHAKSTAITYAYVIANVVFRVSKYVLIVSDTETQATLFLDEIKKAFTNDEDLVKMFGIRKLVKDAISDIIVEFDDGQQARITAKGSGQSLRGVKWDNKRPDLIVCDDMENDELVMNKDRREKFRRWITGALVPCLAKHGKFRAVGTILHSDSQLERWMPKRNKVAYEQPLCIMGKIEASVYAAKYRAHDPQLTVALWPDYKPVEWLRGERQRMIDDGLADVWSQEMLNNPLDQEHAVFRKNDFVGMSPEDKKKTYYYYIGTDFAVTVDQRTDYTSFVVGAIDDQGALSVVHVIKERLDSMEIEDMIFYLNEKYKPEMFFFEKGQIWNSIEPHVIDRMVRSGTFFSYKLYASITDKKARASSIAARCRARAVKFDMDSDWWPDFEEELLGFPRMEHDDQVDALSILGRGLKDFISAPTPEEQREEEREEELMTSGFFDIGRSSVTGY